jgi:DNA-binding response OmpR family regulator
VPEGNAAEMAVRRTSPDAVVLDINIPVGSGIKVLRKLRHSAKTQNIPVIVVSGNQDSETHQTALKIGTAQFLGKPVDLEKLAKLLADLISTSFEIQIRPGTTCSKSPVTRPWLPP